MSEVVRPTPWSVSPTGYHFEAVPDEDWIIPPVGAGRCRFGKPSCKKPAIATLMRGYGPRPTAWDYCSEHLYGRWIEDGRVFHWRLVMDAA